MQVVDNKKKTNIKTTAFLPAFPGSTWPPHLLLLQATLSLSPFREEASGAKGVLRGCDQGAVVSLCHSFPLTPFFLSSVCPPQAAGNVCSTMEHLVLWPWGSFCCFSLFPSSSLCHFLPFPKYVFPEVPPAVHRVASGLFAKRPPLQLPFCQSWAQTPNTRSALLMLY